MPVRNNNTIVTQTLENLLILLPPSYFSFKHRIIYNKKESITKQFVMLSFLLYIILFNITDHHQDFFQYPLMESHQPNTNQKSKWNIQECYLNHLSHMLNHKEYKPPTYHQHAFA